MYEDEISPEELFNRFFGGGGFGGGGFGGNFGPFGKLSETSSLTGSYLSMFQLGGGMFDGGPSFVFNMGGGPGFRVHQFGGPRPRRRPREATNQADAAPPSGFSSLSQFLPLLLLFLFPLISSLFSSSTPSGPSFRFDSPAPPHTLHRTTPKLKLNYYLNPIEVEDYSTRKLRQLDQKVEVDYVSKLRYECESEIRARDRMIQDAQGWFFPDVEKMKEARKLELRSCKKLESLSL